MQQPSTRGSSRARRSASVEPPSKRSHSPQPPHPSIYRTYIPYTALTPFFTTLSFFIAATDHLPLLPFPAFITAFILALIPSRLANLFVILRQARPFIPLLSALHALHVLCALYSIRLLGPARALIALAAPTSFPRRSSRYVLCLFLSLLALILLAYDACGGTASNPRVIRVRDKVLQSRPVHAVHTKLQRLSKSVESRYLARKRQSQAELAVLHDDSSLDIPIDHLHPSKPDAPDNQLPPQPPQPLRHNIRRRLHAIVQNNLEHADDPPPKPNFPPDSQLNQASAVREQTISESQTNQHVNLNKVSEAELAAEQLEEKNTTANHDDALASNSGQDVILDSKQNQQQSVFKAILGVILAVGSSATCMSANQLRDRVIREVGHLFSVQTIVFFSCATVLFPVFLVYCILGSIQEEPLYDILITEVLPRAVAFGVSFLFIPLLLQQFSKGSFRLRPGNTSRSRSRTGLTGDNSLLNFPFLQNEAAVSGIMSLYMFTTISMMVLKSTRIASNATLYPLSVPSYLAAILLLLVALIQLRSVEPSNRKDSTVHEPGASSSIRDIAAFLEKAKSYKLQYVWKTTIDLLFIGSRGVKDVFIHARSNKASWQVLNFLILQSGMAIVELVYAAVAGSSGLISISADNLFCSVALAIGLLAIRTTNRKPTAAYTYGFARYESLCGFANGIMLMYVAVLLVLEAFERLYDNDSVEVGRVFSVCLFGMTGNALGLYFFPPESRRENHNVHGIYLHILANTLAYASMSICTAITAAAPEWEIIDIAASVAVASGITISAVPLVTRSARLLLLVPPFERREAFKSVTSRLSDIQGVVKVAAVRLWNMTPTHLVASAKLEVSQRYKGDDVEVLQQARAIFASVGVPASQCTVQIRRVECDSSSVIFFHRRTKSGLRDTGIDIERLAISRQSLEQD